MKTIGLSYLWKKNNAEWVIRRKGTYTRQVYKAPLPARKGSKSSPEDGLLVPERTRCSGSAHEIRNTEASLNIEVSYAHTGSQKAGCLHSESHREIRILEHVAYLRVAPGNGSTRVGNFNRDRKGANKRCMIKKDHGRAMLLESSGSQYKVLRVLPLVGERARDLYSSSHQSLGTTYLALPVCPEH